jgi:predicted nucleotidyltransferase
MHVAEHATIVATTIARQQFPDALGVWLVGSSARGTATATSDVDVLVVQREGSVFRDTFRSDDALVELFVHSEVSLGEWYERESREYQCGLAHMLATGTAVLESTVGEALQRCAREHVDQGPPQRTTAELDALRYHLSSAVDDLVGCLDQDEAVFIAHEILALTSELELARQRSWTGRGQWRFRWLSNTNPHVAHRLAVASRQLDRDRDLLVNVASDVLARAGGRLQEGYRLTSESESPKS